MASIWEQWKALPNLFQQKLQTAVAKDPHLKAEVYGGGTGGLMAGTGAGLGLPEFGVSEALAAPARVQQPPYRAPSGGFGAILPKPQPGVPTGVPTGDQGPPMEVAQPFVAPQLDLGPAYAALEAQGTQAYSGEAAEQAKIEEAKGKRIGEVEAEQALKEREFGRQEVRETEKTRSAGEEIRRGFSELQKNIIGRFGAGVSTGLGAIAHLGGETMRTLATNAAALQQTLDDVKWETSRMREQSRMLIDNVTSWAETSRAEAKHSLDQSLSQIATSKAVLESKKAEWRQEALNEYLDYVRGINQRNTQYKQAIWAQDLENQQAAARFTATANRQFTTDVINLVEAGYPLQEAKEIVQEASTPTGYTGTQLPPHMLETTEEEENGPIPSWVTTYQGG